MTLDQLGPRHSANVPQGTITYHERGSGDPLLFVHGLLVNGLLWRKVVPELEGDARCIVPHLPLGSHPVAMDASADLTPPGLVRQIADFLDALGLERVTLVGNDTGGALSQLFATTHPDRVERLVLTPCDAFENFPPPMFRPLLWGARLPGFALATGYALKPHFLRRTPVAFGWLTKNYDPEVADAYLEPLLRDRGVRRDVTKALKGIKPRYTLDAAAKLPSLDVPSLIVWAREDRFFPYEHAERLATLLRDSRLVPVDDSYSFVPEDQPHLLAEAIRGFLRETSGDRAAVA